VGVVAGPVVREEYETLVLDCPLYKKMLVLTEVEVTETVDGVGMLVVKKRRRKMGGRIVGIGFVRGGNGGRKWRKEQSRSISITVVV